MAFAYMPDLQQALLFGGQGGPTGYLSDTWSWKAGCWTQLNPATNPPPLHNLAAAYDVVRSTLVLWGQHYISNGWVAETWLWHGQDWHKSSASTPQGYNAAAAFDPNMGRAVLFDSWLNEMWSWDGAQWNKMSPAHEPGARQGARMVLDPATKSLLLFGGVVRYPTIQYLSDTWLWNGTDWIRVNPGQSPPGRDDSTITSFAAANQVLLFGGLNGAVLDDAWAWDGKTWTPIASFGVSEGAGAIDTGSRVIVFGGWSEGQFTSATRSWDGASWATQ